MHSSLGFRIDKTDVVLQWRSEDGSWKRGRYLAEHPRIAVSEAMSAFFERILSVVGGQTERHEGPNTNKKRKFHAQRGTLTTKTIDEPESYFPQWPDYSGRLQKRAANHYVQQVGRCPTVPSE